MLRPRYRGSVLDHLHTRCIDIMTIMRQCGLFGEGLAAAPQPSSLVKVRSIVAVQRIAGDSWRPDWTAAYAM